MQIRPRPNLFIIGAMKSGTTSLHTYLSAHPQIFMSDPKEPNYFIEQFNWSKGKEWYLELFAAAGDRTIVGESSVGYAKVPTFSGVPQRIAEFNPEARFVYIMRDPVERTISHYWHAVRYQMECRDMLTAIRENDHFRHVSHYAAQLAPYVEVFGKDRIFALTLEEMVAQPLSVIRKLLDWLGVDPSFDMPNLHQRRNVTPERVLEKRGRGLLIKVRQTDLWKMVQPLVPDSLRRVGRQLAYKPVNRASQPVDDVVGFLRPIQLEQTRALSKMLGRHFPEWTTLFGRNGLS